MECHGVHRAYERFVSFITLSHLRLTQDPTRSSYSTIKEIQLKSVSLVAEGKITFPPPYSYPYSRY